MTDVSYKGLSEPFFILAPMDDVTDTVFRQVINDCAAPDITFTEFTNVDGLQSSGRSHIINKLIFNENETNLIVQLWGKKPENFYKTAKQIANGEIAREVGVSSNINFIGVDLNMGCPQKNEVSSGTCAALINDRPLAKAIIDATKEGLNGRLPISVKTRTGYSDIDLTWHEFLLQQNLNMLTIHGRTKKDKSKVPANWEVINKIRQLRDEQNPETLIVGNGDVLSRQQAVELAKDNNLDGIMIGRGVFYDPYIFSESSPWATMTIQQKISLYIKHIELFINTWGDQARPVYTLNKFCKIYINGFDHAKEMREQLMSASSPKDLLDKAYKLLT